ncbi:Endonuclease/exonuclease/phosphatase, partial [Staphylotrichum tortipilum]
MKPLSTTTTTTTTRTQPAATMAPSTLDLLILTFNCAKSLINPSIFASHLQDSLARNGAGGLPDLVVFSLQEVAPLSYAFIGPYFLNPYYARFGEALNRASSRLLAGTAAAADGDDSSPSAPLTGASGEPYTLMRSKNVGMTAILLYARDPARIQKIEEAECGFGAADMGNKGAVGLRVTWRGDDATTDAEFTFVAAHLAAMEWNLKKRNANWRAIVSGLTFANPRSVLPGVFPADASPPRPDRSGAGDDTPPPARPRRLPTGDSPDPSEEEGEADDSDGDAHPLLPRDGEGDPTNPSTTPALQALSIFAPSSLLFLAGDLNYRIASTTPPPLTPFPSFNPESEHYYPGFLPRDQLTRERLAGRTLHGMSESPVTFGPTYKFDVLGDSAGGAQNRAGDGVGEVPWRFAPHRWPAWTDRVLYLDVPGWVDGQKVEVETYEALPLLRTSDHRPVVWRGRVPVLGGEVLAPPKGVVVQGEGEGVVDPRVRMPVPVDVHAWERR